MMDASIDDLLAQLQKAQERKSSARLSERNVVELISKLQALGFLGDDLLHTTNGREYLTADHLCSEIQDAVHQAGGRLPRVELPSLLGVDLTHCEAQAARAVKQGGGSLLSLQAELFTASYFDNLAVEVNELLQEAGSLVMADLARKFNLAADLMTSTISGNLGGAISGRLEAGLLYTSAYLARIKAQVRGSLRAASTPVALSALFKELQVEGAAGFSKAGAGMVEELVAEGWLKGRLKAGTWLPAILSRSQQASVSNFYTQNGYIEYDTVAKAGISGAQSYLTTTFPGGIALESAYVARSLLTQLEGQVAEALAASAWIDVMPLLPSVISPADAASLLAGCPSLLPADKARSDGSAARQLAGSCAVSGGWLEEVEARLLEHARLAAKESLRQGKAPAAPPPSSDAASGAGPSGGAGPTKAGGPGKKGASAAAKPESDDDDDWGEARGRKGKKARGRSGAAKSGKGSGPSKAGGPSSKPAPQNKAAEGGKAWLDLSHLADKIVEWYPETEGAGEEGQLPTELARLLRPAAVTEYDKAINAVFLAGAEARRRRQEGAAADLVAAFERLQLYARGCELLESLDPPDEAAVTATRRHLVRGLGSDALDALLRHQQVDLEGDVPEGPSLTQAQRNAILAALPTDVAPAAKAVSEQLAGSSVDGVLEALEGAAQAAGLRLRRLDKKAEKALLASVAGQLQQQLQEAGQPSSALSLAVPLLALQVKGRAFSVPGKALTAVIRLLQGALPEETYNLLLDFHTRVVACLRAQGSAADSEEVSRLTADLEARLPALKAAAGLADAPAS